MDFRQCDGLAALSPGEVDTVVIAGMGGDLMVHILSAAPWIRDVKLILQPMIPRRCSGSGWLRTGMPSSGRESPGRGRSPRPRRTEDVEIEMPPDRWGLLSAGPGQKKEETKICAKK